jgi:hypothetical protein
MDDMITMIDAKRNCLSLKWVINRNRPIKAVQRAVSSLAKNIKVNARYAGRNLFFSK